MSEKMRLPGKALMFAAVAAMALTLLVLLSGCGEKEPTAQQPQSSTDNHASMEQPKAETAAVIVQETCPIMGGPINEAVFVEYHGKKVYFCCAGCPEKFLENPEKYVAKLPQFQGQQ